MALLDMISKNIHEAMHMDSRYGGPGLPTVPTVSAAAWILSLARWASSFRKWEKLLLFPGSSTDFLGRSVDQVDIS